jgi:beta-lactamase regulating signal transducer with metallopeptidase domain
MTMIILAEAAVRATVLALGVALVLHTLRIRSPWLVHGAWTAVLIVMLLLPLIVASGRQFALPVLPAYTTSALPGMKAGETTGASATSQGGNTRRIGLPAASATASRASAAVIIVTVYLAGAVLLLVRLGVGWRRAWIINRDAVRDHGRLTHPACTTPMTVGLIAPAVILPPDWTTWDDAELSVVLAHEEAHARRHDPLVAAIALFNRAIFWFHPLAWWLHREIGRLSEQACDAAVVSGGHDPEFYSTCLVRFARRAAHAGGRVSPLGMAMPGAGLHERLGMLARLDTPRPSRLRVACAALVCTALIVICAAAAPTAASAQNATGAAGQVSWRVDTSEHFETVHDNLPLDRVSQAIGEAETAYAHLAASLKFDMPRRVTLVLVERDRDLASVAGQGLGVLPRSDAPNRQRVLISLESLDRNPGLIVHELTHQFAFEIVPVTSRLTPVVIEGLAQQQRGVWDADEFVRVRADTLIGAIPTITNLDTTGRHWAHAVFDFVAEEQGAEGIRRLLFALRSRETMELAVPMAFGVSLEQFEQAFRGYVTTRFGQP